MTWDETDNLSGNLGWFVLFCLLLHFAMQRVRVPSPYVPSVLSTNREIEVVPLDSNRQFARSSRAEEEIDSQEAARFSGEFRQRVKRETRAAESGRFSEGDLPKSELPLGEDGDITGLGMSDLMGRSASPDHLPDDIATGGQTILNTEETVYASFFNRIGDQIYSSWSSDVHEALEDLSARHAEIPSTSFLTQVTVVLNKDGNVVSIKTVKGSGLDPLDEAARQAFWKTEPFRNPPAKMFNKEGLYEFTYSFYVNTVRSVFKVIPSVI